MAKQIILKDKDGKEYTLEFNRATVERMQRNGFVLDTDRLYMCAKDLITGAFRMHHRRMEWPDIEPIWMAQKKRGDLLAALAKMFSEPIMTLMGITDEDEGDEEENPTWQIVE